MLKTEIPKKWLILPATLVASGSLLFAIAKFNNIKIRSNGIGTSQIVNASERQTNPLETYDDFISKNPKVTSFKILHHDNPAEPTVISGRYVGQPGIEPSTYFSSLPLSKNWSKTVLRDSFIQFPLAQNGDEPIEVYWPDAVEYNGRTLAAVMYIDPKSFWDYRPANGFSDNPSRRFINVGKDFADGITDNGFTEAQVMYSFMPDIKGHVTSAKITDSHFVHIKNALLSFDSLNGGRFVGQKSFQSSDGIFGQGSSDFRNKRTGEFTTYKEDLNNPGIILSNPKSNIISYYSPMLHQYVNGGRPDGAFWDSTPGEDAALTGKDASFFKNSIIYQAVDSPFQTFQYGSGFGHQWFRLSSHSFKPTIPNVIPKKTTTHYDLGDPDLNGGKPYTYTIRGVLPHNTQNLSNGYYNIIDNVDKRDSVDSVDGSINGKADKDATFTGNTVNMNINKAQLEANEGKPYVLHIHVDDNRLTSAEQQDAGQHTISNTAQTPNGPTNTVTNIYNINKKPNLPNQTPTDITKSTTHHILTHPGEHYTYKINGKIPNRINPDFNGTQDFWQAYIGNTRREEQMAWNPYAYWNSEANWNGTFSQLVDWYSWGDKYLEYPSYLNPWDYLWSGSWEGANQWDGKYNYYNDYGNDHYNLTDTIPSDDSIVGKPTDSIGVPITVDSDKRTIHMDLNSQQMSELSEDPYQVKIHVMADNLPNPTSSGWHDIYNTAQADEQLYSNKKHGDKEFTENSNTTDNRIKAMKYHAHWYDFNEKKGHSGDFVPSEDIRHFGYNDSDNPNWESSADLNSQVQAKDKSWWATPDGPYTRSDAGDGVAYHGERIKIPVNQDFHNGNKYYRFAYDETRQNAYPILGYSEYNDDSNAMPTSPKSHPDEWYDSGDEDGNDSQSFYKPYVMPKADISNKFSRFIVDTDKQGRGLPFRLDFRTNSYRFNNDASDGNSNFDNDFKDDYILATIRSHDANGTVLKQTEIPFDRAFAKGHHAKKYNEWRGVMNTDSLPSMRNGQPVPLYVSLAVKNDQPDDDMAGDLGHESTVSHGYTADQYEISSKDFHGSDKAVHTSPERTIKYGMNGSDTPRTQYEQLVLRQEHQKPGRFMTGYGIRPDLKLTYSGLMGADDNPSGDASTSTDWANGDNADGSSYKNQLHNSTMMDFAFPSSFNQDTLINHSNGHDIPYNGDSKDGNNGLDSSHQASIADRLQHDNDASVFKPFDESDDADANLPKGTEKSVFTDDKDLDTADHSYSFYNDKMIDDLFDNDSTRANHNDTGNPDVNPADTDPEYLRSVNYTTTYHFAPRKLHRNSGKSNLADNAKDPLASQGNSHGQYVHATNSIDKHLFDRLFTPMWLPLSTDGNGTNDSKLDYNTVFEKARPSMKGSSDGDAKTRGMSDDAERLGGNYFNIIDSRSDEAFAHMYEADSAPHDPDGNSRSSNALYQDKADAGLSIQPSLSGHKGKGMFQHIKGFSKKAMKYLADKF